MRRLRVLPLLLAILLFKWAQAEPNGYNYDYDNGCDMVRRLGYKESYTIYNFPPEPAARGGRGCVWEFVAADEGCTLQFRTHGFERGANDCEEHFLSIGDETKNQRICEFGEPPRLFTSKGRKLMLSYHENKEMSYKQSDRVRRSRLSGVVRCVPLRRSGPQNESYSNNGHAYAYNVPTTAAPMTTTAATTGTPMTKTTASAAASTTTITPP